MPKYPRWLPQDIIETSVAISNELIQPPSNFSDNTNRDNELNRLDRLLTDRRMKVVWERLSVYKKEQLPSFLIYAWKIPEYWQALPKITKKDAQAQADKIIELTEALIFQLDHSGYRFGIGKSNPLELSLSSLLNREYGDREDYKDNIVSSYISLIKPYMENKYMYMYFVPSLADCLRELINEVHVSPIYHKLQSPTKMRAKNARRTYYATELSKFMRQHFKRPLHEHVATTTSVALDLPIDEELNTDDVRKLK